MTLGLGIKKVVHIDAECNSDTLVAKLILVVIM